MAKNFFVKIFIEKLKKIDKWVGNIYTELSEEERIFRLPPFSRWKAVVLKDNKIKLVRVYLRLWWMCKIRTRVATVGFLWCECCNKTTEWSIWKLEVVFSLSFLLLWIPALRTNRRFYLICTDCRTGYEISKEEQDKLLTGFSLSELVDSLKKIKGKSANHSMASYDLGIYSGFEKDKE